jgi:hypothetical protein
VTRVAGGAVPPGGLPVLPPLAEGSGDEWIRNESSLLLLPSSLSPRCCGTEPGVDGVGGVPVGACSSIPLGLGWIGWWCSLLASVTRCVTHSGIGSGVLEAGPLAWVRCPVEWGVMRVVCGCGLAWAEVQRRRLLVTMIRVVAVPPAVVRPWIQCAGLPPWGGEGGCVPVPSWPGGLTACDYTIISYKGVIYYARHDGCVRLRYGRWLGRGGPPVLGLVGRIYSWGWGGLKVPKNFPPPPYRQPCPLLEVAQPAG